MVPPDDGPSIGELSRQLANVFIRLEGLANRLEGGQFVRTDLYEQYQKAVDKAIHDLEKAEQELEAGKVDNSTIKALGIRVDALDSAKASLVELANLDKRVGSLEDEKKWSNRLVLGFIILAALGALVGANGGIPQ